MFWSTLLMALNEIRSNALRSALTMLGIVIGVAAVIVLVSIGEGTTAQVTADIGKMGKDLVTVMPGAGFRGPGGPGTPARPFELSDAEAVAGIPGVAAVAPTASASRVVVFGNQNATTTVTGTTGPYLWIRDLEVGRGRWFTDSELSSASAVCVLGETVRKTLFGASEAVGESVRIGNVSCRVAGVLAPKGQSAGGMDQDDIVLMPISAFHRRIAGNTDVRSIVVKADSATGTTAVVEHVSDLLRERRRIAPGEADDFHVRDTQEIVRAVTSTTAALTVLLSAIAAVSLVVGGIGIMNIMLVSVTERTREIGIRVAIGALPREVMLQFLVEATVLSLFGGMAGIAIGVGGAYVATRGLGLPFGVAPATIGLAFAVSAAIGIAFGFLPARKAARLEPIDALRHE